jgi:hypothetical protein
VTADTRTTVSDGTRIGRLWMANLLGPLAALAGLEAGYALVDHACPSGQAAPMHVVFAAALLLALAGGVLGWREWRRWGSAADTEYGGSEARSRFLALVGVLSSAVAALALAAQWSASLFLHPCQ